MWFSHLHTSSQVDKFLEETEQYLAGQGFNLLAENEKVKEHNNSDRPATGTKQKIPGRRKPQKEEEKSTIPFHGEEISSTAEKVNISKNETDVKNVISGKKTQKTSPKQAKARKLPQNSKKEFSKSNFSMNKILQNSSPKEELKGKD